MRRVSGKRQPETDRNGYGEGELTGEKGARRSSVEPAPGGCSRDRAPVVDTKIEAAVIRIHLQEESFISRE